MPKYHPIFRSFAGGEVSPRLSIRQDLENVQQGAAEMTNMQPLRHGPAARRVGMQYVATFPGTSTAKLFTFHVSPAQSFVVSVIDDGLLRVDDETGSILLGNLVTNPHFDNGLISWTDDSTNNADVLWRNGVAIFGATVLGREARLGQSVDTSGSPNGDHEVRLVGIPGGATAQLQIKIGTAVNDDSIDSGIFISGVSNFTFNPGGANSVWITLVFTAVLPLGNFWSVDSVRCSPVAAGAVEFAHPWGTDDISDMQAEMPPGEDVMFFTSPRITPQELSFNKVTDAWAFQAITFNSTPAEWTGTNFPGTLTFFQGRSWWGGTPDQQSTFWGSKSGQIRNMDQGTEGLSDDAVEFTLSRRGRIEWMQGVKNLLMGTENGEFIIDAEQGIIEPGDIQVTQQSSYGAQNARAVPLGNEVLFLSADGTKLRRMGFSWTEDGWLTQDMMWPAEHLGVESSLQEIDYVKDPESAIYCVTGAGEIYSCTLDPNSNFVGWGRITTDGRIISVTVTQSRGASIVWALVDRRRGDPTELFLERLEELNVNVDFLDSHVHRVNDPASAEITGVTHLANQEVSVVVDGAIHPNVTLDAQGDATLNFAGTQITVGLTYKSVLKTLPIDVGSGSGSGHSMTKRWNRIVVRVLDSALPLINGERQPDRSPATLMDEPEPNRTQDIETRQVGFDDTAQITIEQDLPARNLVVVGVFGEYAQDSL